MLVKYSSSCYAGMIISFESCYINDAVLIMFEFTLIYVAGGSSSGWFYFDIAERSYTRLRAGLLLMQSMKI